MISQEIPMSANHPSFQAVAEVIMRSNDLKIDGDKIRSILNTLSKEQASQLLLITTQTTNDNLAPKCNLLTSYALNSINATICHLFNIFRDYLSAEQKSAFLLTRSFSWTALIFFEVFDVLNDIEKKNLAEYLSEPKNNILLRYITPEELVNATQPGLIDFLARVLSEEDRIKLMFSEHAAGNIPLHLIGYNGYNPNKMALSMPMLNFLPKDPKALRAKALLYPNIKGEIPLQHISGDYDSLRGSLECLNENEIVSAILHEDIFGMTPLDNALDRQEKLENLLNLGDTLKFDRLELLLNTLSETQKIQVLTHKRQDGKTVLDRLFSTIVDINKHLNKHLPSQSTLELSYREIQKSVSEIAALRIQNLLKLLPENKRVMRKAFGMILGFGKNSCSSPVDRLLDNDFLYKFINPILVFLDLQPLPEKILSFGSKDFPETMATLQLKFTPKHAVIARQIITLIQTAAKLEMESNRQRLASNNASSDQDDLVRAANVHFENAIKPYLIYTFYHYGTKLSEYPKDAKDEQTFKKLYSKDEKPFQKLIPFCLIAIEKEIRKTILDEIQKNAENDLAKLKPNDAKRNALSALTQWITEKKEALILGDPKTLKIARETYFTSIVDTAQIAWRCYDLRAPIKRNGWPNLFVHQSSNQIVFSTEASISGPATLASASNIIRERTAYYYLISIDEKVGSPKERQERIMAFINNLAEIRRAHNDVHDPASEDNPSCFPGTITRLANIGDLHSIARVPKNRHTLIKEVMGQRIIKQFHAELMRLKNIESKEQRRKAMAKLLMALIIVNDQNAEIISESLDETSYLNPDAYGLGDILSEQEVSEAELIEIRQNFTNGLGKEQEIIDDINKRLLPMVGQALQLPYAVGTVTEGVYLELARINVGGSYVASTLVNAFRTDSEWMLTSEELKAKAELELKGKVEEKENEFSNPYPLPSGNNRVDRMSGAAAAQIEASREKQMLKHFLFEKMFKILRDTFNGLIKTQTGEKAIFDLTHNMVDKIFEKIPAIPLKEIGFEKAISEILPPGSIGEALHEILKILTASEDLNVKKFAQKMISDPETILSPLKSTFKMAQSAFYMQQDQEREKRAHRILPLTIAFNEHDRKEREEKVRAEADQQNENTSGANAHATFLPSQPFHIQLNGSRVQQQPPERPYLNLNTIRGSERCSGRFDSAS